MNRSLFYFQMIVTMVSITGSSNVLNDSVDDFPLFKLEKLPNYGFVPIYSFSYIWSAICKYYKNIWIVQSFFFFHKAQ